MLAAENDDNSGSGINADNKQSNRTTESEQSEHDTTLHGFRSGACDVQIEFSNLFDRDG